MKAFLWACAACLVISVAAAYILTGVGDINQSTRTADSVRLN